MVRESFQGGHDKRIKIWDLQTGTLINTLNGHTKVISCICISPNGEKIISGSDDCSIKIWELRTGALVNTLNGHLSYIHTVCISPDNEKIISASHDRDIKIWDARTGVLINTIIAHQNSICIFDDEFIKKLKKKITEVYNI